MNYLQHLGQRWRSTRLLPIKLHGFWKRPRERWPETCSSYRWSPPKAGWEGGRGQKARHMLRSKPYPGDAQAVAEPWELLQAAAQSIYFWDAEVIFCSRGVGHGWIWSVPPWEAPPLVRIHPKWKQGGALSTVAKIRNQLPATCQEAESRVFRSNNGFSKVTLHLCKINRVLITTSMQHLVNRFLSLEAEGRGSLSWGCVAL